MSVLLLTAGTVKTPTCQATEAIAQYLNVYISNLTHTPSDCQPTRLSLCNNITCPNPHMSGVYFNMSFIPCGERVGYYISSGRPSNLTYNYTFYESSAVHFSDIATGNLTLERSPRNRSNEVVFQVCVHALLATWAALYS